MPSASLTVRACRIDRRCRLRHHGHAAGGDLVIAELLLLDRSQSGDDIVAERAGGESLVRLDQRDLQFRVDLFQSARAAGAAKTAADHDDAGRGLRERRQRKRQRRYGGRAGAEELPAADAMAGAHAGGPLLLCRKPRRNRAQLVVGEAFGDAGHDRGGTRAVTKSGHRGR